MIDLTTKFDSPTKASDRSELSCSLIFRGITNTATDTSSRLSKGRTLKSLKYTLFASLTGSYFMVFMMFSLVMGAEDPTYLNTPLSLSVSLSETLFEISTLYPLVIFLVDLLNETEGTDAGSETGGISTYRMGH